MMDFHMDGELNGLIKEYLEYFGLENATKAFVDDCNRIGISINECNVKPPVDEILQIQEELLYYFDIGNRTDFFALWTTHVIHKSRKQDKKSEKLEFLLQIHFAVFPFRRKNHLVKEECETTMCYFRSYLETKGTFLSQCDDLLPYYALPYVSNPKNHPTFKKLFEEVWVSSLKKQLEQYLQQMASATECSKQPNLLELYKQNNSILRDTQAELRSVQQKWKESEKINMVQAQKLAKLQEDCRKLMAISTDIVSALESAVKGNLTDLDNVLSSCMQRFPGVFKCQNMDNADNSQTHEGIECKSGPCSECYITSLTSNNPVLDYVKIKNEFFTAEPQKIAVLVQALRWRLTKQPDKQLKLDALNEYIENDLLGSTKYTDYTKEFFEDVINLSAQLHETFTRFINAVALFHKGQKYLLDCPGILSFLQNAVTENKYNYSSSNMALSALQKLSKHQEARKNLIETGIVEWLLKVLLEEECTSNYRLYSLVSLLLNLCISTTAKIKCKQKSEELLNIMNSSFPEEEAKKSSIQLNEAASHSIVELRQLLICLSEQEFNANDIEAEDENNYKELEDVELEIEMNDPVNCEINGENFLKGYLNLHNTKEVENCSDSVEGSVGKNISAEIINNQLHPDTKEQGISIPNGGNAKIIAPSPTLVSEPLTPKVDDEATEMVRKIIGETSKTLVAAERDSSPIHIEGHNSKEYTLAFSSRPKIPRTPEAGQERSRSSTPLSGTYKIKKDNSRERVVLPRVASSSPPLSPTFEQHSPGLVSLHTKIY